MTVPLSTKLIHTIRKFRGTAYYYYGRRWSSLFKFLYYSLLSVNNFVVYGADLREDLPTYALGEGFSILKPTQEQLDDLRRNRDLPREFYYDRIHGVKKCYIVMYDGDIAYIHWVYTGGNPSRFLRLRERVAELNYITTMPKYRGQGLMGKVMANTSFDLREEGYTKVVGVFHAKNLPAVKSAKKAGWSEMARIRTLGPFNKKLIV
jgi:GNAT superfamily N-acetyltransferase